ncbi:hypothetical protein RSPO_c01264 [Ralstonia solanacearum Po82]|uniref:Uncharacterized protein n=1 Tax=Ralstonia solanacearum (strain Po82) TaxID=1031711 RepID=F6FZY2_RALS8|nr:hypothetical protein RSPO_c01264 [Ralstonia solanacearum Po82]
MSWVLTTLHRMRQRRRFAPTHRTNHHRHAMPFINGRL